jgi:hypothetical protein
MIGVARGLKLLDEEWERIVLEVERRESRAADAVHQLAEGRIASEIGFQDHRIDEVPGEIRE